MTIPELILDDLTLTWDDLVDIGRRAIPPGSDGIWTQHGPVDPGITLMELFAYQLEQRLYMLDRVPDTLIRAVFARLAGPDAAPRPATAATTTLSLRSDTRLELPVETRLTRIIDGRELLLTTSAPVVVTPGATIARVELDGVELPTGTFAGHVFGRSGLAPARIRLTATGPATEHLLYVGLADDPLPGAPPDTVRWTADRALSVEDGTLGLRCSGIVRLRAADGLPLPATVDLVVSRDRADGPVWPRLTALAVNAVRAAHSHRFYSSISSGPLSAVPSLQLSLPDRPPIDDPARFSVIAGADGQWTVVADLAFSGPDDRHVQVDRPGSQLIFGDGRSGRIPAWPPETRVALDYRAGGGVPPDVGPGVSFSVAGHDVTAVTQARLSGGAEPEPIADARERFAGELALPSRAITVADVKAIVRGVRGTRISRVHVRLRRSGDRADVFCVPRAPRDNDDDIAGLPAPVLDGWTRDRVAAALDRARLIGYRFAVCSPAYHPVEITVIADVQARDRATAERRIASAIRRHLDPLVGGADGAGHPFGDPVGPPDLTVVAQRALGDRGEVTSVLVGDTDCDPLPLRSYQLPAVASVTVRRRP